MDHQNASTPPEPPFSGGSSGISLAVLGQATGIALGAAAAVLEAVGEGLRRLGDERARAAERSSPEEPPGPGDLVDQVGYAAIGAGAAVAGRALSFTAAATSGLERVAAAFLRQPLVRGAVDELASATGAWEDRGRAALDVDPQPVMDAGLDLVAGVAMGVLDRLDLNEIIARVDLDRVVSSIDLNEIIARVDLDRVVSSIDLNEVVSRLDVNAIADRLDVNAIADRLDVDRIVRRMDLTRIAQSVIDELDLAAIAQRVMDELDVGEIIRESTGSVTVDTVDAIRVGGMNADRVLTQVVNRLLMRRNGSASQTPADPPGL